MKIIKTLLNVSIMKTIKFNIHYFGIKSLFCFYAIIAKGVQFKSLKGNIVLKNKKMGAIKIEFPSIGIDNDYVTKGTIEIYGQLIINKKVNLSKGSSISIGEKGCMEIDSLIVNGNTKIVCNKSILIGNNCLISWGGYIMDTDFHHLYYQGNIINEDENVIIGNNVWICMNCILLKGTHIPNNSVIGAGSIITKKLEEENALYVNNKVIKRNIEWRM